MDRLLHMGLDVGSTTVKLVVLDKNDKIKYSKYQRHFSDIRKTIYELVDETCAIFDGDDLTVTLTGSGGISVAQWLGLPFEQEVVAAAGAVEKLIPHTDVAIELGGEDAKITFFRGRYRAAHERNLCRRDRRVHRPDGVTSRDRCRRTE